jgi:hypothetical protein
MLEKGAGIFSSPLFYAAIHLYRASYLSNFPSFKKRQDVAQMGL